MIIAQITDTHLAAANAADPVFRARAENLRECIADINGLDPMPDRSLQRWRRPSTSSPATETAVREWRGPSPATGT